MSRLAKTTAVCAICLLPLLPGLAMTPAAAREMHPIVYDGFLLGGSEGGRWYGAEEVAATIKGGEQYKLYSMFNYIGIGTGGKLIREQSGASPAVEIKANVSGQGDDRGLLALRAEWNPLPRVPLELDARKKAYRDLAARILKENRLPEAPVEVKRVLRVDLEGDGSEETLLHAEYMPKGAVAEQKKNTYSFIFLRRLRGHQLEEFLLAAFFGSRNEGSADSALPYAYNLHSLADLNGDGILDILIGWSYQGGSGYVVDDPSTARFERVLQNYAGS